MGAILRAHHVLRAGQFNKEDLNHLFKLTNNIRKLNKSKEGLLYLASLLNHKRVMLYFTQPSTRTFLSFQSACHILGLKTSEIRDPSTSSEKKGECIEDSLRTFSSYVDLVIMRSPVRGLCERMASLLDETNRPVPIINAGSGPDEHPTQALLDLYTLERCFKDKGGIHNKTICFVGDLKRGRTIRSLSRLLSLYNGNHFIFCSPDQFRIKEDLRTELYSKNTITFEETNCLKSAITRSNAIYMTRVQDEYDSIDKVPNSFDISKFYLRYEDLKLLKEDCFILHPFPRRQELDIQIDQDKRAKYWRQERNGMWIRVALITKIFGMDDCILAI